MKDEHQYSLSIQWPSVSGDATRNYTAYQRSHLINAPDKESPIQMSSDPNFKGDSERYNPEELLLGSLSSCHMLWYLHLCSVNGVVVQAYRDEPVGIMRTQKDGSGSFESVRLSPIVTVESSDMVEQAKSLHHRANEMCFIARSVNFPVSHNPRIEVSPIG